VPEDHSIPWPILLAALAIALPLTWTILRLVAERYPRKVLLCAECVVLLTWWGFLSHPPFWGNPRQELGNPMKWWWESLQWLGVRNEAVSGLILFTPIVMILLIFFVSLNRKNALREVPSIIVGKFAPAPDAPEAPHHDEAALVTNMVTKRVAQCIQASQRPTSVPGAPAEFDFTEAMTPAPGTGWAAIANWLICLLAPARYWDVTGTVLKRGDQWLILATVRDRAIRREVLTLQQSNFDLTNAAEDVASTIAAHALNRASVVSDWSSWDQHYGEGLGLYQKAQKLLRDGPGTSTPGASRDPSDMLRAVKQAQGLLTQAAQLEPRNLLVRLELAKTHEVLHWKKLDALELHLRAVADCPTALQPLYRAAIAFQSFSAREDISSCPARLNASSCERFNQLWSEVSQQVLPAREVRPCQGGTLPKSTWRPGTCVYQENASSIARGLLRRTRSGLRWWRSLLRFLGPFRHDPALTPTGLRAKQFKRSVKISFCCLDAADLSHSLTRRRERGLERRVRRLTRTPYRRVISAESGEGIMLRWIRRLGAGWIAMLTWFDPPAVGWQSHYNAACFYSLMLRRAQKLPADSPRTADADRLARTSLWHLRRAVYDSAGLLPVSSHWLRDTDPDLRAVRDYPPRAEVSPERRGAYWEAWMSWMTSGETPRATSREPRPTPQRDSSGRGSECFDPAATGPQRQRDASAPRGSARVRL
jgi:hypothetical protein